MAAARVFTELISWQKARVWSKTVFERTEEQRFSRDRRLDRAGLGELRADHGAEAAATVPELVPWPIA